MVDKLLLIMLTRIVFVGAEETTPTTSISTVPTVLWTPSDEWDVPLPLTLKRYSKLLYCPKDSCLEYFISNKRHVDFFCSGKNESLARRPQLDGELYALLEHEYHTDALCRPFKSVLSDPIFIHKHYSSGHWYKNLRATLSVYEHGTWCPLFSCLTWHVATDASKGGVAVDSVHLRCLDLIMDVETNPIFPTNAEMESGINRTMYERAKLCQVANYFSSTLVRMRDN